jgi:regulator of sigma E protease
LTIKLGEDKDGTVYTLTWVLFGGFVNLGENNPEDPKSLANFPKRVRLAALLAGAGMNIVAAFVIFVVTAMVGYPEALWGVGINGLEEGSPAQAAGIQTDDIVLRVDDLALDDFGSIDNTYDVLIQGMVDYVATKSGESVTVLIQRGIGKDADKLSFEVVPRANKDGEGKMGVMIAPVPVRIQRVHASLWEGIRYSVNEIWYTLQMTIIIPIQVVQGLISPDVARPVGPVGIAVMTGDAAQQSIDSGWAYPILHLAGLLNVAIAFTNLLPLPALDGGRVLFVLLEAVRGKPVPPEKESLVHGIGLLVLLVFFVFVTVQDVFVPLPEMFNWADYLY